MKRWRLKIRQLMGIVLACALGFAALREALRRSETFEILAVCLMFYFVTPLVAWRFDRERVVVWNWFAIAGLLYLSLSQGTWGIPPGDLPTTQWLDSLALKWFPPHLVADPADLIYHGPRDAARGQRNVFLGLGQVLFSLLFALYGAFSARVLRARRMRRCDQERARSDRLIAEHACDEPLKPFPL